MKKTMRFVCIMLVCSLLLAVPAQAASAIEPRESAFFSSYGFDLEKVSSTSFRIWFDVVSNVVTMDELGASEIVLYRSTNQENWVKIRTYTPENYPQMLDYNSVSHAGYVSYNYASSGYYYTACITYYAKNSTGIGERSFYTEIIRM